MDGTLHSALGRDAILGHRFRITVDRPVGFRHEKHGDVLVYPINYGEIEGLPGGDGEWQDVFILGVTEPLTSFEGRIVAIIHRLDDVEDKWVTCPDGMTPTDEEILAAVSFQEKYYHSVLIR